MGKPKKLKASVPVVDQPETPAPVGARALMPAPTMGIYTVKHEHGSYTTKRYLKALAFVEGLMAAGAPPPVITSQSRN